uniref:Uncharacterized protein n=1 Tax=Helianthus annuus TaxID=4232 RepID=A0A251VM86_HELAN
MSLLLATCYAAMITSIPILSCVMKKIIKEGDGYEAPLNGDKVEACARLEFKDRSVARILKFEPS